MSRTPRTKTKQLDRRAFPKYGAAYSDGMFLRDYFAAAALNGMLASDSYVDRTKVNRKIWAKFAYEFADAMLEQSRK